MSKTKKEIIIEAFERMDMNMLEVVLDDNKTYQEATKEIFLKKLASAFQEIKDKNVVSLKAHKGFCNSDECPNKGCNGYAFVDDVSKQYISLIFDETEDDVSDIYNCNTFKTTEEDAFLSEDNRVYFSVRQDEESSFSPTVDYLITNQKCSDAIEELNQYKDTIIGKEIIKGLVHKYRDLKKFFDLPPIYYTTQKEFYFLYCAIDELYSFTRNEHTSRMAFDEYHKEAEIDEKFLLFWASKYEETGNNLTLFLYDGIDYEHPDNNEFFDVRGYKILTKDFENLIKFKGLHDSIYWDLLDKYTTYAYTDELWDGKDEEYNHNRSLLTYHLKARGIIE